MRKEQIISEFGNLSENLEWLVEAVAELTCRVEKKLDILQALEPDEMTEAQERYFCKIEQSRKDHEFRVRASNSQLNQEIERHKNDLNAEEPSELMPLDSPVEQEFCQRHRMLVEKHNEQIRLLRKSFQSERTNLYAEFRATHSEIEGGAGFEQFDI